MYILESEDNKVKTVKIKSLDKEIIKSGLRELYADIKPGSLNYNNGDKKGTYMDWVTREIINFKIKG